MYKKILITGSSSKVGQELIKLIPIGIKSQLVGKRPPIFHKNIPGVENIRKIFERYRK